MTGSALLEFVEARLRDVDEAAQEAAAGRGRGVWRAEAEPDPGWFTEFRDRAVLAAGKPIVREDRDYAGVSVVDHIARHDPDTVRADVAAKLALVDYVLRSVSCCPPSVIRRGGCPELTPGQLDRHPVLRALAAPHAGHPDHSSAWTLRVKP